MTCSPHVVKIEIFMTKFTPHVVKTGIFTTKFTPHVVKIDFYYKIYTSCGKNYHSNVVVTSFSHLQNRSYFSDVSTATEDISVCGENYLIMPSGVKNCI